MRIIEDISTIRHIIGRKKAGSFTYTASYTNEAKRKWNTSDTIKEIAYVENNDMVHMFQFIALTEFFYTSENKSIRTHMLNSIKWKNPRLGTPIWKLLDIADFIVGLYKA